MQKQFKTLLFRFTGHPAMLVVLPILFAAASFAIAGQELPKDPWTPAELMEPRELQSLLNAKPRPKIICVGFHSLYRGGHVPGAEFHGPGASPEGLADLKAWAQKQPRGGLIVLYCGCCPFNHCPNIRPAYLALHDLGFTRLRVLNLPHDFARDWVEKGYPTQKGGM